MKLPCSNVNLSEPYLLQLHSSIWYLTWFGAAMDCRAQGGWSCALMLIIQHRVRTVTYVQTYDDLGCLKISIWQYIAVFIFVISVLHCDPCVLIRIMWWNPCQNHWHKVHWHKRTFMHLFSCFKFRCVQLKCKDCTWMSIQVLMSWQLHQCV